MLTCMYVCVPCGELVPTEATKGFEPTGRGDPGISEPPCVYWESNLGPLEGQPGRPLTTEPSLQLPIRYFLGTSLIHLTLN